MMSKIFKLENIPNAISVFRIFLIPLYALLFFGVIGPADKKSCLFLSGVVLW